MANDLTGEFDVCLQLSHAAVDMVVAAGTPVPANRSALVAHGGLVRAGTCAPPQRTADPADDVASRIGLLREVLEGLAEHLPSAAVLQLGGIEPLGGGVSVFANVGEVPTPDVPVSTPESFLGDDDGFGIALSRGCVESVVRRAISGVSFPAQFEVRLRGQRGAGLVRWNVSVDVGSAGTVVHGGGAPVPGCEDMLPGVLVALPGTAVARGIGSLYADLDFTFELVVPFVPEVAGEHLVFWPGEAQFRLLGIPIALEPFHSRIVTIVRQHLSVIQDKMSSPTTLDVGRVAAAALGQGERLLLPILGSVEVHAGVLVLRGRLELESPLLPSRAASTVDSA